MYIKMIPTDGKDALWANTDKNCSPVAHKKKFLLLVSGFI
jgi:hypothetical protein